MHSVEGVVHLLCDTHRELGQMQAPSLRTYALSVPSQWISLYLMSGSCLVDYAGNAQFNYIDESKRMLLLLICKYHH